MSTDKEGGIDIKTCHDNSPFRTLVNNNVRTQRNDNLAHGNADYRLHLSVMVPSIFLVDILNEMFKKQHCTTLPTIRQTIPVMCIILWTMPQSPWILMTSHSFIRLYMYTFMLYLWRNLPGDILTWKLFPHYWAFVRGYGNRHWFTGTNGQWCMAFFYFFVASLNKLFNQYSSCQWIGCLNTYVT